MSFFLSGPTRKPSPGYFGAGPTVTNPEIKMGNITNAKKIISYYNLKILPKS